MDVKIGVSNRHVHLCREDYKMLFGNEELVIDRSLIQPGEFASAARVSVKTQKNVIDKVRVLGPLRPYTQVEISKTDAYVLGIKPPIRTSGDLIDSENVTIVGPCGEITKPCCIIANRHIHINHVDRIKYNLLDKKTVSIEVGNEKTAILNDVYLKETENGILEVHLDTDDANANFIQSGDIAKIIE